MKKLFTLLCAALFSATAFAGEFPDISIADLKTAIADKKVVILDVNGTDSYKSGHVPGALDFDAVEKDLAKKLPAAKDSLVVAYCGGPGCNAYVAGAKAAKELGYTNVKHLAAGIAGWKKAGEPTEAGETKKSDAKSSSVTAAGNSLLVAKVDGVVCASCKNKVSQAFASVGAKNIKIADSAKEGEAVVTFEGDVNKEAASKALGEFTLTSLAASK
jgi:rhodanese-related sulfurtransferase/copper chaperone CopZ